VIQFWNLLTLVVAFPAGSATPQHKTHCHWRWVAIIKSLKRKKFFMRL